jgi:hypothetical protein
MSGEIAVYVAIGERNLLAGRLYPHRRAGGQSPPRTGSSRQTSTPWSPHSTMTS